MNYNNGKIYKITDIAYTKMYIGSTTQSLSRRFSKHKASYKLWKDGKCGRSTSYDLFDEFGIDNCKIELIEEYECESKMELERKEGEHIKLNNCVNKHIAGRTQKEYRLENKDAINQKNKQYNLENKDTIKQKKKQYNLENKDTIKEKASEKLLCECGKDYTRSNKNKHIKRKHHINHLVNQPA